MRENDARVFHLSRNAIFKKVVTVIIAAIIIISLYVLVKHTIHDPSSITRLTKSAGVLGPVVLVLLIILGILLTPIPSFLIIIISGLLYGAWQGALYSYIGHVSAAIIVFFIVKKFQLRSNNKNNKYKKYRLFIKKNQSILYLLYLVPVIPISVITIITASSKMSWKEFLKIVLISFAPAVIFFSFFGQQLASQNFLEIGIITFVILLGAGFIVRLIKKKTSPMKESKKTQEVVEGDM